MEVRIDFAHLIAKEFNYSKNLIMPTKSNQINFYAERPKNTRLIAEKLSDCIDVNLYSIPYILKLINKSL